jgi:hypothetical protein
MRLTASSVVDENSETCEISADALYAVRVLHALGAGIKTGGPSQIATKTRYQDK